MSKLFLAELRNISSSSVTIFIASIFSCFVFYTFVVNLRSLYRKIQMFFFRSTFVSYIIPFVLFIAGISCFILPKVFNFSLRPNLFIFLGGFIFTAHLSYIAAESKGTTFPDFVHYLFILSILYILNLLFLGLYLNAFFNFHIGKIAIEGIKSGAILIQSVFAQAFS
jgi:hypothetical protein